MLLLLRQWHFLQSVSGILKMSAHAHTEFYKTMWSWDSIFIKCKWWGDSIINSASHKLLMLMYETMQSQMYRCIICLGWKKSICCSKLTLSDYPSHQRINIGDCKLGLFGTESTTLCSSSASILPSMGQIIAKTLKEECIFLVCVISNAGSFPLSVSVKCSVKIYCRLHIGHWSGGQFKEPFQSRINRQTCVRVYWLPFDRGTRSGVSFSCLRHPRPLLLRPHCWPRSTLQSPFLSRGPSQNPLPLHLAAPSAARKDLHLHAP